MTVVETLISLLDQTIIGIWSVVKRFEEILVKQQSHPCLAGFYLVPCLTPWQKIQFHRIWSFQECPFAAHKDEELVNTVEKFGKLNPLEYKVKGEILANLWKNLWTLDNGQRYEVELPLKDDCLPILDNYNLCYNRLKSMQFKLSKTPGPSCSKAY